jgi:Protein of unknown function (DUF2804)
VAATDQLPWRGPGADRPDLPLPPGPMPLRRHGQTRKRWRYVGVYAADLMLCAARAQVGPLTQSFWTVWDVEANRCHGGTRLRPGRGEVAFEGPLLRLAAGGASAELRLGDGTPVESICPSGEGWGWTRKRAGVPVEGTVRAGDREWRLDGEPAAVVDESAGYHRRHTTWRWSAGVGRSPAGTPLAWNLVTGINDPPRRSERAIWEDGRPREPDPVVFEGLAGIRFEGGAGLAFDAGAERARDDNLLVFRSRYRHVFGTFSGSLDGIELAEGFGVMEEHEAVW